MTPPPPGLSGSYDLIYALSRSYVSAHHICLLFHENHVWAHLYHSPPVYFRAYPTPDLAETLGCEFSTLNLRFEGGRLGSN